MKKKILSLLVLLTAAVTGAWAEEKMVTINSSTMSSGAVTATGLNTLLDNLYVGPNPATITTSEGVITKLVIKKGSVYKDAFTEANVGVTPGTITYGSDEITVTDINAESVTLSRKGSNNWSTSTVDVYYGAAPAPATDFIFNVAKCEHGSGKVTFTVQDKDDAENITENAKGANEGDKVTMTITPDEGWVVDVDNVKAKAATNWEAAGARRMAPEEDLSLDMLGDIELTFVGTDTETGVATYTFTMPASSVMASAAYLKLSTLYFDPADRTNLMEIKVGDDKVNVEDNKTVKIEKVEKVTEGTPVKLTANTGYKFRKVEVKKGASGSPLATPLTIEALTAGTIQVNIGGTLQTGMKYSVNGGTKTLITKSTDITVAKDDKVQFYGNGTDTQAYGDNPEVSIQGSGDGFQTKVYGNIMSLLDETGFATMTELPDAPYIFYKLFKENTTLIDASELLLPATKLVSSCYFGMFSGCTNLTKAPKLPATTLTTQCYYIMFKGCTSLTSAYVKAAYINESLMCTSMFDDCTATGAVLHTTSDNKASWENVMGSGKTWETWSVADDWQE